jgi:hypothetical protein
LSSRKILCVQFEIETLILLRSVSKPYRHRWLVEVLQAANQTMHVSTDECPSNGASLKSPNPLHRMCLPHGGFNSSITESESKESKESTEAEDHNHPHLRANSFARYSSGFLAPLLDLNTNGGGRRIVNILKN